VAPMPNRRDEELAAEFEGLSRAELEARSAPAPEVEIDELELVLGEPPVAIYSVSGDLSICVSEPTGASPSDSTGLVNELALA
jgi:hypothetical protein